MREEDRHRRGPETGDTSPPRLWPWVVAFMVAAVAVWFAVTVVERSGPPVAGAPGGSPTAVEPETLGPRDREPVAGAVAGDLLERAEEMRAAVRRYEEECVVGLEPEAGPGVGAVVADCIDRLVGAIDAIVASDTVGAVVIEDRMVTWRRSVRQLESRPPEGGRAAPTRAALISAAETLNTIAEERYTESLDLGDGPALGEAAASIDADRPLVDQQERVRRFFVRAGAVLSAMARPGDPGPTEPG